MRHFAIAIVGAGPAGTATALALCQARPEFGESIALIDRARFPRHKPCGGGVTRMGQMWLDELGLAPMLPSNPITELLLRTADRSYDFRRSEPFFEVFEREAFDLWLLERVRETGTTVMEGESVLAVSGSAGRFELTTNRRSLRASIVVAADGSTSAVRRSLVPADTHLSRLLERIQPGSLENSSKAVFDFGPVQSGIQAYRWSFPSLRGLHPAVNSGVFESRLRPSATSAALTAVLESGPDQIRGAEGGIERRTHPLRNWDPASCIALPGVLFVGDALGADPLLGEGISFALAGGVMAGRAIASARCDPVRASIAYEQTFRSSDAARILNRRRRAARLAYGRFGRVGIEVIAWTAGWVYSR